MKKYVVKNCPYFYCKKCKNEKIKSYLCKKCNNCIFKQIAKKCDDLYLDWEALEVAGYVMYKLKIQEVK